MRSNERDRLNTVARFKKGFLRKKWGQVHSLRNIRVGPDPIFLRHLFTLKYYLLCKMSDGVLMDWIQVLLQAILK